MSPFFVDLGDRTPDTGFLQLEEIFHLEDQLADVQPDDVRQT